MSNKNRNTQDEKKLGKLMQQTAIYGQRKFHNLLNEGRKKLSRRDKDLQKRYNDLKKPPPK